MKTLISNKRPTYTAVCSHRATESTRSAVYSFTTLVKERTGAELALVSYDENGVLREIWNAVGWKQASFGRNGALKELLGIENHRLARYDENGVLTGSGIKELIGV